MEQVNDNISNTTREALVGQLKEMGIVVDLESLTDEELKSSVDFYSKNPQFAKKTEKLAPKVTIYKEPKAGLTGEQLRQWWVDQLIAEGIPMSQIPTTNDYERLCIKCGSINPCTGVSTCIQCGTDISPETGAKNFIRMEESNLHSPSGQR